MDKFVIKEQKQVDSDRSDFHQASTPASTCSASSQVLEPGCSKSNLNDESSNLSNDIIACLDRTVSDSEKVDALKTIWMAPPPLTTCLATPPHSTFLTALMILIISIIPL